MADGVALLVAPRHVMRYAEDMLALSPNIRRLGRDGGGTGCLSRCRNARPTI